ncbi:MAG: hypothetical protein EON59_08510 [Alphaproteobacteria bacterium]|nr:MAG: hypothetical protein EON59_08510 [Alphaproteobacteria bacterium]
MMTVADLIAWLGEQPQDLPVIAYNDGMPCSPSLSIFEANSALLIARPALFIGGPGEPATASELAQRLTAYDGQLPVWVYDDGSFEDAAPVVVEAGDFYQFEKIDQRSIVI